MRPSAFGCGLTTAPMSVVMAVKVVQVKNKERATWGGTEQGQTAAKKQNKKEQEEQNDLVYVDMTRSEVWHTGTATNVYVR